ncbi:MAG TPA: PAS domain S-box protein, partial [Rhodoferax sp.]
MLARDPEVVSTLTRFGEHPSPAPSDEEERRRLWSNDATLIKTSKFLQDSAKNLGLDVLNLLNANGDCVASSSIDGAKNIIGTDYSDHNEFLRARAGQPGYLVTMGKKMYSTGLNYYVPVMHQGRFVGVVSGGNALASFTNLIKQADAYLTDNNGVVMLARDPSLMMHALPNAPFARLDAATRQAFYQSTELPTLQLARWGNAQFPELLRVQGRDPPAILRSQLVADGGLTLNVLWPMPQLAMLDQQRLIYAVTFGTIGTLLMLLTATGFARRRDQHNLTQELMQREQEFRSLAANLPVAVIRYDSQCRRRYLNPAAEKMLHGNATELLGQPPGGRSVPATPAMIEYYQGQMVEVLATGAARDIDLVFDALPVDKQDHFEVRFAPERGADGEVASVLAIWLDITERKKYELTLLERAELEQRQSQFFSVAPGFFYTTVRHPDGEYEITFASHGIRDLLGLEPQAVMQDSRVLFNAAHPDDQITNTRKSEESERDLTPFHIEYRIIHPTQGLRWVEVHLVTQRLANGGARWDGFMHDITERKSLENQVAQRERDFRSLADNMPDNVARWNVDGRYLYLNPVHERTLAISASDMIGKSIPDSHVNVKAVIAEVVSTGQSLVMNHQPILDENGDIRLHDVSIVPECDETGKVVSVLGIGRDMTDVYRMQETIATSELAFRSLAESSPDFISRYDREGRHLYFNDRLLRRLGLNNANEAIGKRPGEVWPDGRFVELEQVVARAMESGKQKDIEIVEPTEGGNFRYHQIIVVPEEDVAGQVMGAIAFGREITAIREAERKLAHFIDNLPGMVYTFRSSPDGRGSFPYMSPAIEAFYGLKPEDVKDDMAPIHALVHPDDQPRIEAAMAEAMRTLLPMHVESRVCRKDNPERWLDVRAVPERQADGSLLWYGLMLDITERKRMEEQLAAREQEFRALAENSPDTIARYAPGGVRTYINPLFARLAGKPVHDLLGVTAMDYQAAPGAITYHRILLHSLESGEDAECEYTWPSHDGRLITSHIRIVPEFGADGKVASVLAIGRDITERKHLENELKQRETEFRALTENLPDPVFRYDRDCRRTYVNPAAVRVTGLPIEQLIGHTPTNCAIMKKDSAERTMLVIRDVFATGERRSHFVEYVNEDGSMSEYQGLHVPEFDANGQVASVLTIEHEVTNLRKAERRAASFFVNMPGFAYTFVISPEGRMRFLFASQGIEDIFGLRPENVRDDAVPMRATAHSDEWPRVEAAIIEAARTQQPFQLEARMQRLDQPERWIECRSMPEKQAGGEVLWHGIM